MSPTSGSTNSGLNSETVFISGGLNNETVFISGGLNNETVFISSGLKWKLYRTINLSRGPL